MIALLKVEAAKAANRKRAVHCLNMRRWKFPQIYDIKIWSLEIPRRVSQCASAAIHHQAAECAHTPQNFRPTPKTTGNILPQDVSYSRCNLAPFCVCLVSC